MKLTGYNLGVFYRVRIMNLVVERKIITSKKLSKIRMLVLDVDGVLTDGKIIISNNRDESKHFNVKDGLGIKLIQQAGIKVVIITGKSSRIVTIRCSRLGIKDILQNQKNKLVAFQQLKQNYQLNRNDICYIGDDLPDLAVMKQSGFSAAPQDAIKYIKSAADYICNKKSGQGAVREVCDLLLSAKGLLHKIINDYMELGEVQKN